MRKTKRKWCTVGQPPATAAAAAYQQADPTAAAFANQMLRTKSATQAPKPKKAAPLFPPMKPTRALLLFSTKLYILGFCRRNRLWQLCRHLVSSANKLTTKSQLDTCLNSFSINWNFRLKVIRHTTEKLSI